VTKPITRRESLSKLASIAEQQDGFFSAAQATVDGVDNKRLQRLVGQGIIERDSRGIYRFVAYPRSERDELWRAVLWPTVKRGDALGVLSHATALSLYDITTIAPQQIDITVPTSMRLRKLIPETYKLRYDSYSPTDVTTVTGLPATTLFRTLFDLIVAHEQRQFVIEAIDEGPGGGILTQKEAQRLRALIAVDPDLIDLIAATRRSS
jgi:predicted transcriptional regulator of viral defense system